MQRAVQRLGNDGELPVPQRTVRVGRARLHVGGRLRVDADAAQVVARHPRVEAGLLLVLLPDPSVHAWRLLRRPEGRADPGGRADVVALPRHGDLTRLFGLWPWRLRLGQGILRRMEPEPYMANLRRGTVEFCVLALVRREAKYAAELGAELSELGLLTSEGTLYPLLSRLRRERLVETSWVESEAGPPRRYYSITAAGRQALRAFHQQWATFTAGVNRLLEEKR